MLSSNLEDYIFVVENVLDDSDCELILAEYSDSLDWVPAEIRDGVCVSVRNVDLIPISTQTTLDKNAVIRKNIDSIVFSGANKALTAYKQKFPTCGVESDSGYELLRYREGQFYIEHTDSHSEKPRILSCSFALNDEFSGGEFSFFYGSLDYKIPKGGAILFPSNFMYPHQIRMVNSGCRYSIVTWFA